jgi:hypothetical protein
MDARSDGGTPVILENHGDAIFRDDALGGDGVMDALEIQWQYVRIA